MSLFTDPFDGVAGDEVTTMTKTKGGTLFFKYHPSGNAIIPSSIAADIRYVHDTLPGQANYRAIARFQFNNPVSASKIFRLFARYQSGDLNCYYVQVDTNFNDPQIKLFSMVDGTPTQIGSTFAPGAGAIPADTDRTVEIQVDGDQVSVFWNGNTDIENPDISAQDESVYVHGTVGIGSEFCGATDIIISNLEVNEPRRANEPSSQGTLLKVDDVDYDVDEMKRLHISIESLKKSIVAIDVLEIKQKYPFTSPLFRPEQTVQLFVDIATVRTRVFHGKMRVVPQPGEGGAEEVSYMAYGYRANWQYISVEQPSTLSSEIVWNGFPGDPANGEPADDDFDMEFSALSVGAYLKYWLDYYKDTIYFYYGADPRALLPYVQTDLDAMTNLPTKTTIRGTLDTHIMQALSFERNTVPVMDYQAGRVRFRDLDSLTTMEISAASKRIVSNDIGLDTSKVFTAARAKGVTRELVQAEVDTETGELEPAWDDGLEPFWDRDKAKRTTAAFIVVSVSVGTGPDGRDEIVVSSDGDETFQDEWKGTSVKFQNGAAMGDHYEVYSNSAKLDGEYTFVINGNFSTEPDPGDVMIATDDMTLDTTKRHNGFAYVYKLFQVTTTEKKDIARDRCAHAMIHQPTPASEADTGPTKKVNMGTNNNVPKDASGLIRIDNPAVDLTVPTIVFTNKGCNQPTYNQLIEKGGKVGLQFEYYKTTVVQARFPTEGWYGPAFSDDAARYGVGSAVPAAGDIGVMREELIEDEELQYAEQSAAWLPILEERVKATSRKPWNGSITYRGLDWTNRDFTKKITITFDSSKRDAPNWSGEYFIPIEWEWNFRANTNTVTVGILSDFARTLEAQKQTDKTLRDITTLKRRTLQLKDMQSCFANQEATSGAPDEGVICGANVYTGNDSTEGKSGKSLDDWADDIWWWWWFWWDFLNDVWEDQKGISNADFYDDNGDGKPDGIKFDFGGETYFTDADGNVHKGSADGPIVDPPWTSSGFDGMEGSIQDAVMSNKAALEGLTFTGFVMGEDGVLHAAFTDANGNTVYSGPGGFSTTPGGPVISCPGLGGVVGGLLHNAGKTIANGNDELFPTAPGTTLTPGTSVPPGGAKYYPPGSSTPTPLAPGATVPGSTTSKVDSNKKLLEGMTAQPATGAVQVPAVQGGSVYLPNGTGFVLLSGSGLPGPSVGGMVGSVAGKCGSTFDGAAEPGSGPGSLVAPGETVGADGAYYYPPTQNTDQPEVHQLSPGDEAPASTLDQVRAICKEFGLIVEDAADPGGVVYRDTYDFLVGVTADTFWRVEPSSGRLKETEAVTAGTGINGGDWDWVSGGEYHAVAKMVVAVQCSPTADVDVSAPGGTHDSISPINRVPILLQAQTDQTENGIWIFNGASNPLTRDPRFDNVRELPAGLLVCVQQGPTNKGLWRNEDWNTINVGLTSMTFVKVDAGGGSSTPAGTLAHTAAIDTPSGWLDADGSAVAISTYPSLYAAITITQSGSRTSGSPTITGLSDTSKMVAGMPVCGTGIPSATTILSVDSSSQITLSNNASSTGTNNVVVAPFGVGNGTTTFNVPDGRAKFDQGTDAGANYMGSTGGSLTPTITDPGHTHSPTGGPSNTGLVAAGVGGAIPTPGHTHTVPSAVTGVSIADGRPPFLSSRLIVKT